MRVYAKNTGIYSLALTFLTLSAVFANGVTSSAAAPLGALEQFPGPNGCMASGAHYYEEGCAKGRGLDAPNSVTVSPDNKNVYVASGELHFVALVDAIAILDRNQVRGTVTQPEGPAGCLSMYFGDACGPVRGLNVPTSITTSPDGKNVYVASYMSTVTVFKRDASTDSHALTQLQGAAGCVSKGGKEGCTMGRGLEGAQSITISPDGKSVYVGSPFSSTVAIFNRDPTTGALTQLPGTAGCVSEDAPTDGCAPGRSLSGAGSLVVDPEGKNVYVASKVAYGSEDNALAIFKRNSADGSLTQLEGKAGCIGRYGKEGCAKGRNVWGANSVAISPDGKNVYVAGDGAAILGRDQASGAVTQLGGKAGCVVEKDYYHYGCALGRGLPQNENSVAVSPDGKNVYVGGGDGPDSDFIAVFERDLGGRIAQLPGAAGCVSENGRNSCARVRGLFDVNSLAVSPDGKNLYGSSLRSRNGFLAIFKRET